LGGQKPRPAGGLFQNPRPFLLAPFFSVLSARPRASLLHHIFFLLLGFLTGGGWVGSSEKGAASGPLAGACARLGSCARPSRDLVVAPEPARQRRTVAVVLRRATAAGFLSRVARSRRWVATVEPGKIHGLSCARVRVSSGFSRFDSIFFLSFFLASFPNRINAREWRLIPLLRFLSSRSTRSGSVH